MVCQQPVCQQLVCQHPPSRLESEMPNTKMSNAECHGMPIQMPNATLTTRQSIAVGLLYLAKTQIWPEVTCDLLFLKYSFVQKLSFWDAPHHVAGSSGQYRIWVNEGGNSIFAVLPPPCYPIAVPGFVCLVPQSMASAASCMEQCRLHFTSFLCIYREQGHHCIASINTGRSAKSQPILWNLQAMN